MSAGEWATAFYSSACKKLLKSAFFQEAGFIGKRALVPRSTVRALWP